MRSESSESVRSSASPAVAIAVAVCPRDNSDAARPTRARPTISSTAGDRLSRYHSTAVSYTNKASSERLARASEFPLFTSAVTTVSAISGESSDLKRSIIAS